MQSLPDFSKIFNPVHKEIKPPMQIYGLWDASVCAFLSTLDNPHHVLIICPDERVCERLYSDLNFFGVDNVVFFPAWEALANEKISPHVDIVGERLGLLWRLRQTSKSLWIIAPIQAFTHRIIDPAIFDNLIFQIKVNDQLGFSSFIKRIEEMGYHREPVVERKGEYSVRGGILDLFCPHQVNPYRFEFNIDSVESIRLFDVQTQCSIQSVNSVQTLPAHELELPSQNSSLMDYCGPKTSVFIYDFLEIKKVLNEIQTPYEHLDWEYLFHQAYFLNDLKQDIPNVKDSTKIEVERLSHWHHPHGVTLDPQKIVHDLTREVKKGFKIYLVTSNEGQQARLKEILEASSLRLHDQLHFEIGYLSIGFLIPSEKIIFITDHELFGRLQVRAPVKRFKHAGVLSTHEELHKGDWVVHMDHGVGRFCGIDTKVGKTGEFLIIAYQDDALLYVPMDHIHLVERYMTVKGQGPKLNRLGTKAWNQTKIKTQRALIDFASELLDVDAKRQSHQGYAFSSDTGWQKEFDTSFSFEETPDQIQAIQAVKKDMENSKPMDRIICGDVGFGKTEVAIRAAFKAVMDHKQVVVLVPTTILAQQHLYTFSERISNYPISTEMLSRFRTAKEQKDILHGLKEGTVDIVIGTHRLLSADIKFKDLGLIIIDEEQRFGVGHKERLKRLKNLVDVLTLSATPIPRTLYLALTRTRHMSQINTAPENRFPVETIVSPYQDRVVVQAIQREIARSGQVFYVYNRVKGIEAKQKRLHQLISNISIGIAHGQMHENDLEDVMKDFIEGKVQVLLCTSIVESGLDIPNANTIIIDGAQNFGLADLYQLRGRVGRFRRRAYAYILYHGDRYLLPAAKVRLKTIEDYTELGAGFQIALRDLEIRGAGNVLGKEQHGHISSVGFNLYCKLLDQTIKRLKGEKVEAIGTVSIQLEIEATIPHDYVSDEKVRFDLYRRMTEFRREIDQKLMITELIDRFGPVPKGVQNLINIGSLRYLARLVDIDVIIRRKQSILFKSGQKIINNVQMSVHLSDSKLLKHVTKILKGL